MKITDAIENRDDRIAVSDGSVDHTYGDIRRDIMRISEFLKPGSVVMLFANNCYESLCMYLACTYLDCCVFIIDAHVSEHTVSDIISRFEPDYVITPEERDVFLFRMNGWTISETATCSHTLSLKQGCVVLCTSGSSRNPKYVKLGFEGLYENAASISEKLSLTPDDSAITTLPMSYSYGLSVIDSHLISGGRIVMTTYSPTNRGFWDTYRKNRITNVNGTPFLYSILNRLGFGMLSSEDLRFMTQAGGSVGPELRKALSEFAQKENVGLFSMYGQTEASARICMSDGDPAHYESVGKPISCVRIRLKDVDGHLVTVPCEEGELEFSGPCTFWGYAESRSDLDEIEQEGWIRSGDLAFTDFDGNIHICGRMDRVLKIKGYKANLDDIEADLNENICPCRVYSSDDQIVLEHVGELTLDELIGYTNLPVSVFSLKKVDRIPRSSNGKIMHGEGL